jgi:hypothetical protein
MPGEPAWRWRPDPIEGSAGGGPRCGEPSLALRSHAENAQLPIPVPFIALPTQRAPERLADGTG